MLSKKIRIFAPVMTFADITSSLAPELERLNTIIAEALDTPTPLMNEIVTRYCSPRASRYGL